QSRGSLLIWKLFGKRMDGHADDEPAVPAGQKPKPVVKFEGSLMPPPEAVAGTFKGADGKAVKVAPLTDEDRLTLVRWIDLGCPIDLDHEPGRPDGRTGWFADRTVPTVTVAAPAAGKNSDLSRLLVGIHDAYSGIDPQSFEVIADFAVNGIPPGVNLAPKMKAKAPGVWELPLTTRLL